jgi:hypothetical protein
MDAAPYGVFEDLLGARFLNRHRVAEFTVDIVRKAADDLTTGKRKLKLALEDSPVRIEELHLHARFGNAGRNFDIDFQPLQLDRPLRTRDLKNRRSPRRRRGRRRQVLARLRECGCGGCESGAGRTNEKQTSGQTGGHVVPFSKRRIERVRRACKLKRPQHAFGVKRCLWPRRPATNGRQAPAASS